jgi:hypothetical protein
MILQALGFGTDEQAHFLPAAIPAPHEYDRISFDGRPSAHPQLRRAQALMSRAQFSEAHQQFVHVFETAGAGGDAVLQAEAAGWLGWCHGELERFEQARFWTSASIGLIEKHLGMRANEIIESVNPSRLLSPSSERAALVLSRALRIRAKVLSVRIVHHLEFAWLLEARPLFQQSLQLEERLQLPELAHDLRWKAVALSAQDGATIKDVENLLSASRELLTAGSPGEASLIRDRGVVRWQKSRLAKAADFLWDAKERLALFADHRALGPTFCVLSKIILQGSGDSARARRYALIAASLHPYGYVLDHCREQLGKVALAERLAEFEDLAAGRKPFDIVHTVMARVVQGPDSPARLIGKNLDRIRATFLPPAALIRLDSEMASAFRTR